MKIKKIFSISILLIICITCLTGCGSKEPSAKDKYGMDYYDRADGKRIWYYTKQLKPLNCGFLYGIMINVRR